MVDKPQIVHVRATSFLKVMDMANEVGRQGYTITDWRQERPSFWGKTEFVITLQLKAPSDWELHWRLDCALASENYEEAARIRDLMNKK